VQAAAEGAVQVLAVVEVRVMSTGSRSRRTMAGDGASRRYCAQSRSARVAVSVGWRRR
jgi:hypothetical protein